VEEELERPKEIELDEKELKTFIDKAHESIFRSYKCKGGNYDSSYCNKIKS